MDVNWLEFICFAIFHTCSLLYLTRLPLKCSEYMIREIDYADDEIKFLKETRVKYLVEIILCVFICLVSFPVSIYKEYWVFSIGYVFFILTMANMCYYCIRRVTWYMEHVVECLPVTKKHAKELARISLLMDGKWYYIGIFGYAFLTFMMLVFGYAQ